MGEDVWGRCERVGRLQLPEREVYSRAAFGMQPVHDFVVSCSEVAEGYVSCTSLSGDVVGAGQYLVPRVEVVFGSWLADEIRKALPPSNAQLKLIDNTGNIFWTGPLAVELDTMD